jgi:uncharacterized membrane protein
MKDSLEQATDTLAELAAQVKKTVARIERKRSHKLRNTLLAAGGIGVAAVAAFAAKRMGRTKTTSVEAEIEVGVPVTAAYTQWTQFEEFPRFMEGVDEVKKLDDSLLHWAATVAGRRAEWDAQILEQERDRRITWESVDGKRTRGTVTFEPKGPARSRIRLHMSYQADGAAEQVGSAIGLDSQRINGDLARFRELVEARNAA